MKENHIQIAGIFLSVCYGILVLWLYLAAPKNLAEVPAKAKETIENVTTKGQVFIGVYEVNQDKFEEGLKAFRQDNFVAARDSFTQADPEQRDARTQFYIAYSYYRQGFGKIYNDDVLFKKGLEKVELVSQLDKNFRSDDNDLKLKTAAELKNELEEGLRLSVEDFNPLKVLRERK
jgi:hypothetical protein